MASTTPTAFTLSEEQESFRQVVRDFANSEIAPHAAEWDRDHHFPVDTVRAMGHLGLFGITAPEEYGGAGEGLTSLCVAIEEIGRVDQSLGVTLEAAVSLGVAQLAEYGTDGQKQRWLPDLVAGRALAGFGLTEPGAGSDAGSPATRAHLDDDHWVINGAKQFITNSGSELTSLVTVTARTGENDDGQPEVSAIIVPSSTPGFIVEPAYDKLGWHASDTHPLTFADARVPADHLLGERGRGFGQFLAALDDGRIAIAALALGCIEAMLQASVDYANTRTAFGASIGRNQGVAFQIADMKVMADTARMLTYRAAALRDSGAPAKVVKQAAAVAKLQSSEAAVSATRIAAQVHGGYGFMEEYPVARFYRDAKILEIGEGTSEVQRLVIGRSLGLAVE